MIKRSICLSLATMATVQGAETLESIDVVEKVNTKVVQNVSGEEVKSADLAEALSNSVPSITMIRRSGIANDIILRGQKRDNINITIDGAKVYGACVNRMDPPTSHVVTHAIDNVVVEEGPFDVEEFGTLSGSVKITTKKPSKKTSAEVSMNTGSFGYKKFSGTVSGGTDKVRVLFTASSEDGEQYKDGNGDDFATQLSNHTASTPAPADPTKEDALFNYSDEHKGMDAFSKQMYMGKVFINPTDNQEIRLSYTANRSENVLYPSSKMDALYDNSDILNAQYTVKNLSPYSKQLDFQVYNSKVEHPMGTKYRRAGSKQYMTHFLTTDTTGVKLKNNVDAFGSNLTYGLDTSSRNWDGKYTLTSQTNAFAVKSLGRSIADVDTKNVGLFMKSKKSMGKLDVELGARYDDTSIDVKSTAKDNDYTALSANVFATYKPDEETKYFVGIGKSSRVPDGRELYNTKPKATTLNGNPNLNQTSNYELDMGVEKFYEDGTLKVKTFYSKLKDYIYYNSNKALKGINNFENIDANIYGVELSASYYASDRVTLDAGLSYKKGEKDTLPTGQTDRDLAEITPLKLNASVIYDYDDQGDVMLSVVAADKWDNIDSDNGEQVLAGYAVFNLKTTREFNNGFELTLGVDNMLDKTYATTNTYNDLILITDGADNTILMNEPGRYMYMNAKYKF